MPAQRIFFSLLLVLTFCANAAASPDYAFNKSFALIIGIDEYPDAKWDNLKFAVKDARAMADLLSGQGFIIKTLFDKEATRVNIKAYLENELAIIAGPNDRFLFFFAGHGHTEFFSGGIERGYLVPYDGKSQSATYLSMAELRDISDILSTVRHQLYIMDCCYGGRLGSRGDNDSLDPRLHDYLIEITKRKARQILTAGGATQRVHDVGPEGHSFFTGELLKAIRGGLADTNGDGWITFYELAAYLHRAASRENQTPGIDFLDGHEQGEFIFRNPLWSGHDTAHSTSPQGSAAGGAARGRPVAEIVKEAKQKFAKDDLNGALPLFHEASELGNVEAAFFEGLVLFRQGKKAEGLGLIHRAAENGNMQAMECLLEYYSNAANFNSNEVSRWNKEIADAKALNARMTLIDPTGGEAAKGDPEIKEEKLRLQPPRSMRIIR
jgi:hypothetical protein